VTQAPQPIPQSRRQPTPEQGRRRVRIAAVIAVAVVVAFGAWLIFRDGDDDGSPEGPASTAASVDQLRALPQQTGHEIYWAGRRVESTYELTQTTDGNVFIRYLPSGVSVGDQQPAYLTVGSYPRRNALRGLRRIARRQGSVSFSVNRGGLAVYSRDRPNSVYVAFPGEDVQVEVYDPSPQRARRLVRNGRIRQLR
jgi:hypothetical protein